MVHIRRLTGHHFRDRKGLQRLALWRSYIDVTIINLHHLRCAIPLVHQLLLTLLYELRRRRGCDLDFLSVEAFEGIELIRARLLM